MMDGKDRVLAYPKMPPKAWVRVMISDRQAAGSNHCKWLPECRPLRVGLAAVIAVLIAASYLPSELQECRKEFRGPSRTVSTF